MSVKSSEKQPIFYAGDLSYYSGKARSYLHYKKIKFEERLATPEIYKTIIIPRVGYPMIPVLVMPDDVLIQDTTELIDYFEDKIFTPPTLPGGSVQQFVSALLELYGDEWLVIPAMHYRWTYNREFAYREFGKLEAPDANPDDQYKAGKKAAKPFSGVVPLLGATQAMVPAIEASYIAFLHEFDEHLKHHDFLLGGCPCSGDFGLIGPLYAHLYRDPASGEIIEREAPNVVAWIKRMIAEPFITTGDFVDDDQIPQTLLPILKRMMAEQGPCLIDLFDQLAQFKLDNPDTAIPRSIGMHSFQVEGDTGQRVILPYTQWMAQRALKIMNESNPEARNQINDLLRAIGGDDFINIKIKALVMRVNHKLVWEN